MIDKDEVILIYQNNNADKPGFAQRFREQLVYPFQKKRFYAQWENAPMDMRFRLTNKCNENCARCFECSGPNNPLNTVPVDDVIFYGNQRDSNFTNIYMTGGEWSLIYDVQPHFMRKIFDRLDLSKSDEYTIQTNARWVHGQHRDEILDDIKHVQSAIGKHNGILKLDMSVDRYRSTKSIIRKAKVCTDGIPYKRNYTK
jgi:MoaA/NifB/PqqE/SkfB family radical SAM enzyme